MDMADIAGERQLCTGTAGSWQFLSGTWNSGSNTSVTLRLITDGSPTGDIWFDDIALEGPGGPTATPSNTNTPTTPTNTPTRTSTPTRTPTPTITNTLPVSSNLVLNPGFDTQGNNAADAANWTEGTNHARASDKFHTGGWSLHSTYRSAGTDTRTTVPIAVSPNTTYTYSGYVWRTNATGAACMDMADIAGERQLCTSASGSWQFLSGTWNSSSNTSVTLRLITDGSPTGDIWFDDIALEGPGGPTATPSNTNTPGPSPTATDTQPPSACTPVTLTKGPILIFPGNNTQMQVSWQWSSATTFQVQWGTDQTYSLGNQSVTAYDTGNRLYKYTISGLNPGTKYYYQVVVGSQCSRGTFYAAPSDSATSVKFFSYGDTRTMAVSMMVWRDSLGIHRRPTPNPSESSLSQQ
jgi:muramidase (phage lysozyme)